jgi:antagonist of KipI
MSLSIIRAGLLTTVQDLGRPGYQHLGVVVSGALDAVALRVANMLVGNEENAAGLEITLLGPTIRFEADHLIALTGADLSPTLDGQPLPQHRPVAVRAGNVLAFGAVRAGCRAYLAVAGGLAVPLVLGSRSTYLRAGLGGWLGRALQAGDTLPVGAPSTTGQRLQHLLGPSTLPRAWAAARWTPGPVLCPRPQSAPVIRAVRGPEYAQFSPASQRAFWHELFTITPAADRMGYRLSGPALVRDSTPEMLSSAVTFGTVQVPPGGQPIVLLADAQTTGGYPRLAQVCSVDFPALAQARPGQQVQFAEVTLSEAQALYLAQERRLRALQNALAMRVGAGLVSQ